MPDLSHQTARLSPGNHRHPEDGVCVMELASMLAGEPFSDRPSSVCPVIAEFLRTYNDGIGEHHRNDLYRFAAEAVGTRASRELQERRSELCREWISERHRVLVPGALGHLPVAWRLSGMPDSGPAVARVAARMAAKLVRRDRHGAHVAALALVERLISCSRDVPLDPPAGWGVGQTVRDDRRRDVGPTEPHASVDTLA